MDSANRGLLIRPRDALKACVDLLFLQCPSLASQGSTSLITIPTDFFSESEQNDSASEFFGASDDDMVRNGSGSKSVQTGEEDSLMIETDDELAGSSVPLCPAPPVNCGVVLIITAT